MIAQDNLDLLILHMSESTGSDDAACISQHMTKLPRCTYNKSTNKDSGEPAHKCSLARARAFADM